MSQGPLLVLGLMSGTVAQPILAVLFPPRPALRSCAKPSSLTSLRFSVDSVLKLSPSAIE